MQHQEIRFRLLYSLYKKHYSDQLGHQQQTDKTIEESDLGDIDRNEVYGDVVYLQDKGLLKGKDILGYAYPPFIIITSYGIDTVENAVSNFIEKIDRATVGEEVERTIKEISKNEEDNTSVRIRKIVVFLEKHHVALLALTKEIATLIGGR